MAAPPRIFTAKNNTIAQSMVTICKGYNFFILLHENNAFDLMEHPISLLAY